MITIKIDENKLLSTIAVLENYLDGAVPDMLDGNVENKDFILDAIYVHKKLSIARCPFSALYKNEYEEMIESKQKSVDKCLK